MIDLLKIVAYDLFANKAFNFFIEPAAQIFLKLQPGKRDKRVTPKVVLTIDCESGYLKQNNQRVWMFQDPQTFKGYYFGIKNILDLLNKYNIKATFFLSTQCFSSKGNTKKMVILVLTKLVNEGHELGLHLHPKEDFSLKKECKKDFKFTGAKYYDAKTIELMILKSKLLIKKHLGAKIAGSIKSFRWANFALDLSKIKSIEKFFKIDSSICPGCFGHSNDDRKFNWAHYKKNYVHKLNNLTEIPISTFWFFGWRQASPSLGSLTEVAFNKYLNNSTSPFVLLVHSSECTYKDGLPTYVLKNLETFIKSTINKQVKFITLNQLINKEP